MAQTREKTKWGWILTLFFITSFVEALSMSQVFAFLPVYLQSMHVVNVEMWVGVLFAVTLALGLPLVPLWGIWAQKYGEKVVIARSAFVEMAVLFILGISHSLPEVFAAMLLIGLQLGNTGIMLATIRQAVPENRVGYAVSVFSVSSSIGFAVGPLLGGVLTGFNILDLHGLYILDAVFSCLTGTGLMVFYRRPSLLALPQLSVSSEESASQDSVSNGTSVWQLAWQSVRFTFSLRVTKVLFAIYAVLMMGNQMITPYLPIVIEKLPIHFGATTLSIGGLMGLSAIIGSLITVVSGRLGDKVGFVRILLIAFVCAAPALLVLGFTKNVGAFVIALTIFSAGYSMGGAMVFALFSIRIPETHRSTALNLVYLPVYFGGIVGPATASLLVRPGLYGPFVGAAILFTLGIVVVAATRRYV